LDFDVSKCLFIFSYNDENKVNTILKDRMYRIATKGYDHKEKVIIAEKYLIPRIETQVGFSNGEILFSDPTIKHILSNYCKEEGVRNLKRCIEIIFTKLNLYRLVKPGNPLIPACFTTNLEFPISVLPDLVDKLLKHDDVPSALFQMYI
jgi:ATP-dependent Lon protease